MARTKTTFGPGRPPPKSPGRPRLTEEQKRLARLKRAAEYDYKKELSLLFPIAIDQIAEAFNSGEFKGSDRLRAAEMIRDSVHGKPAQTIQGPGGGPLIGSFTLILKNIEAGKTEKL